jgi:hypothetical protein
MARNFGLGIGFKTGAVLALALGGLVGPAAAQTQVIERDVKITGPRGNSVERQTDIRRGPNGIQRDLTIRRPGGTFTRETVLGRSPGFGGGGRGWGYGPPRRPVFFGGGPVFVNQGGGNALGAGLIGAAVGTGAGLLIGSALASPPPPPVMIAPTPVYAVPAVPPTVVVNPPVRYQQAPPQTIVVDEVALAMGRLKSFHESSRLDACVQLGRMGDARAVPGLIDRLKNDHGRDVRVAAATALGEIGEPNSAIVLQRAITYDKKQEVRDAAAAALARMSRPAPVVTANGAPTTAEPALEPIERVPSPPVPGNIR